MTVLSYQFIPFILNYILIPLKIAPSGGKFDKIKRKSERVKKNMTSHFRKKIVEYIY